MEAWGLGMFMASASLFASLLESRYSPIIRFIPEPDIRRSLMGLAMGLTAILLIYSPWGKRSGAHYNPAVTLAFLRQGKVKPLDALFYIFAQFFGGTLGMLLMAFIIGKPLTEAPVSYVVTQPGQYGAPAAFAVELMMSALLMLMVLRLSNSIAYNRYTGVCAGCLVAYLHHICSSNFRHEHQPCPQLCVGVFGKSLVIYLDLFHGTRHRNADGYSH